MRNLLGAFEKVSAPDLTGEVSQWTDEMFENFKRDVKLKRPYGWFENFFFYEARERRMHLHRFANLRWKFGELLEAARPALWVGYVAAKKSPAAVEFEIEIALARFGLNKEFDATVFPNLVEIIRPRATDILILNFENAVDAGRIV
jgi:hypothetical protein